MVRPVTSTRRAWVTLPVVKAPASIALGFIRIHEPFVPRKDAIRRGRQREIISQASHRLKELWLQYWQSLHASGKKTDSKEKNTFY